MSNDDWWRDFFRRHGLYPYPYTDVPRPQFKIEFFSNKMLSDPVTHKDSNSGITESHGCPLVDCDHRYVSCDICPYIKEEVDRYFEEARKKMEDGK